MLEMTHDQLIQKGWTDDELQAYTECTPVRGGPTRRIRIAGVIKILHPQDIGRLLNVKVVCGGVIGTIRPHSTSIYLKSECRWKIAHHIAFDCEQP